MEKKWGEGVVGYCMTGFYTLEGGPWIEFDLLSTVLLAVARRKSAGEGHPDFRAFRFIFRDVFKMATVFLLDQGVLPQHWQVPQVEEPG